jgi:hypothetical protein
MEKDVVRVFMDSLGKEFHENAVEHGFWPKKVKCYEQDGQDVMEVTNEVDTSLRNKGEMIALMHSELSEMLEGVRHSGNEDHCYSEIAEDTCRCGGRKNEHPLMDIHCPTFTSEEVEAADIFIRLLEYSYAFKLRIGEAIVAKHEYNVKRPFKHGKNF